MDFGINKDNLCLENFEKMNYLVKFIWKVGWFFIYKCIVKKICMMEYRKLFFWYKELGKDINDYYLFLILILFFLLDILDSEDRWYKIYKL